MRGLRRIGLLAISLVCMFALMATSAFAAAEREIFNEEGAGRVKLREVASLPKNQPDSIEFVNNGNVELVTSVGTITCKEIEFGTTVVVNTGILNQPLKLAIPFGVAENDECTVPTYFDTNNKGAVGTGATEVASVTITGTAGVEPYKAKFANLNFSQNVPGVGFCTGEVGGAGVEGKVANQKGPFVEEKQPNLNVKFAAVTIPIKKSEGAQENCPTSGKLTAEFLLETPSTATETAWVE